MFHYVLIFFFIAIIAGLFGFRGVAGLSADIGSTILTVMVILIVIGLFAGRSYFF